MNVSKKEMFLIALVVIMAFLYLGFFTDWFRRKTIRIESTVRSLREAWGPEGRADPGGKQSGNVTFSLHKEYRLTSVQVVPAAEGKTNHFAHALWSLTSKKGS